MENPTYRVGINPEEIDNFNSEPAIVAIPRKRDSRSAGVVFDRVINPDIDKSEIERLPHPENTQEELERFGFATLAKHLARSNTSRRDNLLLLNGLPACDVLDDEMQIKEEFLAIAPLPAKSALKAGRWLVEKAVAVLPPENYFVIHTQEKAVPHYINASGKLVGSQGLKVLGWDALLPSNSTTE
jgi:type II secretory pathway component PulJ